MAVGDERQFLGVLERTVETFRRSARAGNAGHIVNTASVAAFSANAPTFGPYAVSKFAVLALSEHLDIELRATEAPVRVCCRARFVCMHCLEAERNLSAQRSEFRATGADVEAAGRGGARTDLVEGMEVSRRRRPGSPSRHRRAVLRTSPYPAEAIGGVQQRLRWMENNEPTNAVAAT